MNNEKKQQDINPTIKQHFVPRFYLKNFADSKGVLQFFDIKNNRIGAPKHYSGVGYANYFYAIKTGVPDDISQDVEKWLMGFETSIASKLPSIIKKILNNEHIDKDDRYVLSILMSLLWLRSPNMREQLNKIEEDFTKQVSGLYADKYVDKLIKKTKEKISDEQKEKLIEMLKAGSYDVKFSNAQHLQFMTETLGFNGPGFTNMFFGQKWKIYITKGDKRFITSDSPLVEWWLPPKTFYNETAMFLNREKYFALTPEILFELTYPVGSAKAKRKTIFKGEDKIVELFNILIAAHANQFIYSSNKELLENIKTGRGKPGKLEIEYYKKYEHPWKEHREELERQRIKSEERRRAPKKNNS